MKNLIGTKEFYKKALAIALPVIIQNAITSFVAMLDNIMVGRLGTDPMSGVAIVNQLIFVFNVIVFGGLSGAGIFCAQFYGKNDVDGVSQTFRFKLYTAFMLFVAAAGVFAFFGDTLVSFYLYETDGIGNIAATKEYAVSYIRIMIVGLLPFSIGQVYSSTLRECGRIKLPMIAGIIAVACNTCLNYILIFGKFGMPKLGADGAAIATVISRFLECIIIISATHLRKKDNPFAVYFYKTFKISFEVSKSIFTKGSLLLINEMLWSTGIAIMNQCYSYRGLSAVAAVNITTTITNLFNIIYLAMGSVVAIMVGQLLGADKKKEAVTTAKQVLVLSVGVTATIGIIMSFFSGAFPKIYNTQDEVRLIARNLILISSIMLPPHAFCHSGYFVLRSGGNTKSVLLVDGGFMYLFVIPLSICLSRFTSLPITWLYMFIQGAEFLKCFIIYKMLKSKNWVRNIVKNI